MGAAADGAGSRRRRRQTGEEAGGGGRRRRRTGGDSGRGVTADGGGVGGGNGRWGGERGRLQLGRTGATADGGERTGVVTEGGGGGRGEGEGYGDGGGGQGRTVGGGGRGWTDEGGRSGGRRRRHDPVVLPAPPPAASPKTRPLQIVTIYPCNRDDAHADTTEQTYGVNEASRPQPKRCTRVHGPTEAQDRSPTCQAVHERHAHDTTPARNKRARAYRRNNTADVEYACWAAGGYLGRASSSTAEGVATPPVVLRPSPAYNSWCAVVQSVCPAGPTSADAVRG